MYYQQFVRSAYNEAIKLHPTIHADLKIALKSNERVPAFVDHLAKEFELVQDKMFSTGQNKIEDELLKNMVYDLTNLFIAGIEKQASLRMESEAKRAVREQAIAYQRDLETLGGDFSDMIKDGDLVISGEE